MKYTNEEKLKIGQQIYTNELTRYQAAEIYGVSASTAREYMRLYRDHHRLPPKRSNMVNMPNSPGEIKFVIPDSSKCVSISDYESLSKEELIQELIRSKINEARLKKGYEVKGVGAQKEYIPLGKENTK